MTDDGKRETFFLFWCHSMRINCNISCHVIIRMRYMCTLHMHHVTVSVPSNTKFMYKCSSRKIKTKIKNCARIFDFKVCLNCPYDIVREKRKLNKMFDELYCSMLLMRSSLKLSLVFPDWPKSSKKLNKPKKKLC